LSFHRSICMSHYYVDAQTATQWWNKF
jgi:hypothetical protein